MSCSNATTKQKARPTSAGTRALALPPTAYNSAAMPAKQVRCEVWVVPEGDRTGERAIECGAIALSCVECGDSAGCIEHALMCPQCKRAICDSCEHGCVARVAAKAGSKRAA